jgi:hypothetical protein
MNDSPELPEKPAAPLSAVERAIRARALAEIEQQQAQPPMPASRRLLIMVVVLVAVSGFLFSVNFAVTGIRRIMDIWYPGSISKRTDKPVPVPAPGTAGSTQPFYITVDPQPEPAPAAVTTPAH